MSEIQSRKPTNLSIDHTLVADARALNINLSRAAEEGIRAAVAQSRAEQWKIDNADAIKSSNAFVDENDVPLASLRQF